LPAGNDIISRLQVSSGSWGEHAVYSKACLRSFFCKNSGLKLKSEMFVWGFCDIQELL